MYIKILLFILSISIGFISHAQINSRSVELSHLNTVVTSKSKVSGLFQPNLAKVNLTNGKDSFHINYIDLLDISQLRELTNTLDEVNFPLTVLHKDVFSESLNLLLEFDALAYQYYELEKSSDALITLHDRELKSLRSIIELERERADVIAGSREALMTQINQMNKQLDAAISIETKSRKRTFGKNFLTAAMGGAVGFALGVLMIEFAK